MRKKILIFGSGSIGTHHANAGVSLNNDVYITDIKMEQLLNMKNNIYPARYKKWNKNINLIDYNQVMYLKKKFDLIIVGVPPKNHLDVLKLCVKKLKYKKILIEKPLCVFNQSFNFIKKKNIEDKIFTGYNHSVARSFKFFINRLRASKKNKIKAIIQWKESFDLVMKAHPWIKSINKSYLSNLKDGGGVSHEYSHALHFFIILREIIFKDEKPKFSKKIFYKKNNKRKYDKEIKLEYKLKNKSLKLIANSLNNPPIKKIDINFDKNKNLNWYRKLEKGVEKVEEYYKKQKVYSFKITRRKDFISELKLLLKTNKKTNKDLEFLNLKYSLMVMGLLKQIFKNV